MSKILSRETNTITVANFYENYLLDKYNFNPAYQRGSVWSEEKQSFFIDSILKNFPIPPIFLHQKIDDANGKTKYDVIDGKQRLNSIINFIKNEIPASDEFGTNSFHDEKIAGIYFRDLEKEELIEYKKKLWRYVIPIEYIDTSDEKLIDNIFDRLNRNGERLNGQELRKSKYHGSELLLLVERIAEDSFWKCRLDQTDVARMEHYEFVSELLFQQIEGKPLHANQSELDRLYEECTKKQLNWGEVERIFLEITNYMSGLGIDYDKYRIGGVSHLYGLWCLSNFCLTNKISIDSIRYKLNNFYVELRSSDLKNVDVENYKKSMSSRTKDQGQRQRRVIALCSYLGINYSKAN